MQENGRPRRQRHARTRRLRRGDRGPNWLSRQRLSSPRQATGSAEGLRRCRWRTRRSTSRRQTADDVPSIVDRARRALHPALVHRRARPAQELLDQRRRARRRLRGRHGLRRLLDHRLQPDRGVGHDRHARSDDLRDPALAPGRAADRPDVLRHPGAGRRAVRGRSALDPAPGARARREPRLRRLQRRPRARVLLLPGRPAGRTASPRSSTRAATST